MGTPDPPDWPPIDDDRWYWVTVEIYGGQEASGACTPPGNVFRSCCIQGIAIRNYVRDDYQCLKIHALCVPFPFQILRQIGSNYPDQATCLAAHP